jgi:hypothetical protein
MSPRDASARLDAGVGAQVLARTTGPKFKNHRRTVS